MRHSDMHTDVQLFHNTFAVRSCWTDLARVNRQVLEFRGNLIAEEMGAELLPAIARFDVSPTLENLVDVADGLVDSVYVLLGAAIALELPWEDLWKEVQRANMSKVWADGTIHRREDGKILKPPGWTAPDIHGVLMAWMEKRVKAAEQPMMTAPEVITPEEQARLVGQWQSTGVNPTHRYDETTASYVPITVPAFPGTSSPPTDPPP